MPQSILADAMVGLNFGTYCTAQTAILDDGTALGTSADGTWLLDSNRCANPDGPDQDDPWSQLGNAFRDGAIEVLNDAPSLNRNSNANNGQIYASANSTTNTDMKNSGDTGAWPFIQTVTMASDNTIAYGNDVVAFEWGNQNDEISIGFEPDTYANGADINLVLTDNGLNIDPTTADKYVFTALTGSSAVARAFANGTTAGTALTSLATIGFGEASTMTATGDTGSFCTAVTVEETGDATGVFVTPDANGASNCDTSATATNHHTATYAYGGESASVFIAYHGGSISMEAGDEWMPAEAATVTISDPDANRTNGYDEALALNVLNAAVTTPYIKTGSPVYLGSTGTPTVTVEGDQTDLCPDTTAASGGAEPGIWEVQITTACAADHTNLQVFIHHDAQLSTVTNKTGTLVLNYDVSSFYDAVNASSMEVSLGTSDGHPAATTNIDQVIMNVTNASNTSKTISDGGAASWRLPCCESGHSNMASGSGATPMVGDTGYAQIKFEMTHPTATLATGYYPIALDFFNFNSTSDIADAIYRIEAEEDGTDGVFTGTVTYATMVHEGNSTNATNVITANTADVSMLLAGDATGTAAPRVLYGDLDESKTADVIGAQLDANTHSGTVTFDDTSYGTSTIIHVTVTDPDLNQDSEAREVYSQASTVTHDAISGDTFSISYNDTITKHTNFNLKETGNDTGVFVGQFVTSAANIGNDLKFTYYDRNDASGTAVDTYTSVKIATESGTIAFDRQVYPVPFFNGWLSSGDGDTLDDPFDTVPTPTAGTTHGNVTVYFTVTDGDETGEQITGANDRVYIKLNGDVIATAGATTADLTSGETGPLTEVERGTSVYEGSFSLDQKETTYDTIAGVCLLSTCAAFNVTSGMVLQAAYNDQTDDSRRSNNIL